MKFKTINQIKEAIDHLKELTDGTRVSYPVAFKKAICEFANSKGNTVYGIAKELEFNPSTLHRWNEQYLTGLFEDPDAVYAVSSKTKAKMTSLREKLEMQITELQRKIDVIKQAEALGLKVVE